jgi:hypothetical protein
MTSVHALTQNYFAKLPFAFVKFSQVGESRAICFRLLNQQLNVIRSSRPLFFFLLYRSMRPSPP